MVTHKRASKQANKQREGGNGYNRSTHDSKSIDSRELWARLH